jgi:3-polyprenyl-4-hydroxybenzoate decarboxylase
MKVVLIVSGSVGVELYPKIIDRLHKSNAEVKVVVTESAKKFGYENFTMDGTIDVWDDRRNFQDYQDDKTAIGHIMMAKWADVVLVCPATANTIGKIVHGIADNLATEVVMAAIGMKKKLFVAPAMNTNMFYNPFVQSNIKSLSSVGVVLYPTVKKLACGDYGIGALANIDDIVCIAVDGIRWRFPLDTQWDNREIHLNPHPGSFGAVRKHDIHTGIDLYCEEGGKVYAVEDGIVLSVGIFTGPSVDSPWWNETKYALIKGRSGVICYGEISTFLSPGDAVKAGHEIGVVMAVLPSAKRRHDISGRLTSMLHLELYKEDINATFPAWNNGEKQPAVLKDPTIYLKR